MSQIRSQNVPPLINSAFDPDGRMSEQTQEFIHTASKLCKTLSHPDRLMLLCQLTQGEYCVSELEQKVGLGQPSLSQQLGILRKDDLVNTRREGKQVYYSVVSADAVAVVQMLYEHFYQIQSTV